MYGRPVCDITRREKWNYIWMLKRAKDEEAKQRPKIGNENVAVIEEE